MGQHNVKTCSCSLCTKMRDKYNIPFVGEKEHPFSCGCDQCRRRDIQEGHDALGLMEHMKAIQAKYPKTSGSRVVVTDDLDTIIINGKVYTGPKKRCSCGKANTKDAKFCSNCGIRFSY